MKKKTLVILAAVILVKPYIYRALVRRNLRRSPIKLFRPNGSHVSIRTIVKGPGK